MNKNNQNIEDFEKLGARDRDPINQNPLLDSSLITKSINTYNIKLIDCNDVLQIYIYDNKKIKIINDNDDKNLDLDLIKINDDNKANDDNSKLNSTINKKNIIRSKLSCQRIAKANINDWKSFITLTFEDNITDLKQANKKFNYFARNVRRTFKDFKYLCITEFQKRGAIHYHVLTNIDINNTDLLYEQEDNKKYKHIKYWNEGFTSIEEIKGDPKKIIGYIAKYMTKDIDNRLFSHRRFFYSMNCNRPIENYIDTKNEKHLDFFIKKIQDKSLIYQNEYLNPYDKSKVIFLEYQK